MNDLRSNYLKNHGFMLTHEFLWRAVDAIQLVTSRMENEIEILAPEELRSLFESWSGIRGFKVDYFNGMNFWNSDPHGWFRMGPVVFAYKRCLDEEWLDGYWRKRGGEHPKASIILDEGQEVRAGVWERCMELWRKK